MKLRKDDRGDLDLTRRIELLEEENLKLRKEIDRLNEYVQNLEIIETNHQKLNGELHREIAKLKVANKQLEDKVLEIHRPINREER
tara:strand:- start:125 stop:382 length:258 start_codon:yes stop_codon:yes gene_type:complete